MNIENSQEKLLITGASGMVGHALRKVLPDAKYISRKDCDLMRYDDTYKLFSEFNPEYVIHLAAKVSGMKGNMEALGTHYTDNVLMNTNVIDISRKLGVKKLLSILSTCVYPEKASYPLTEETIHDGETHWTNLGYGYSKRMIDVQCRAYRDQYGCNFINIIPNNLFGKHDNFHLSESHVIPAIIRKIHEAKRNNETLRLWGDGNSLREFTYSDDLARIIVFAFNNYNGDKPINVGNTMEYSIRYLAGQLCKYMDYDKDIIWSNEVGNGQHRKPSNNSKFISLGWKKEEYTSFEVALKETCEWFLDNYPNVVGVE